MAKARARARGKAKGKARSKAKDPSSGGWWLVVLVFAFVVIGARITGSATPWESWSRDMPSGTDRALADPAPLFADDEFSVYATSARECFDEDCSRYWVPRFASASLSQTARLQDDAMPDRPAWVDERNRAIWAPSVVRIGDRFVMYFSATAGGGSFRGSKCLGTAVAATPAGPFVPSQHALFCAGRGFWALDPYAVSDGTNWFLLWREDDARNVRGRIVVGQLSADGLGFSGGPKPTLIVGEASWEDGSASGGIGPIENPAMARHPDTGEWLLTWSANSWQTTSYATGLATCAGPLGPCERVGRDGRWLRTSEDAAVDTDAGFGGAGGLSFVTGEDEHLYAVFHAYREGAAPSERARVGWVYRVVAEDGAYRLVEF